MELIEQIRSAFNPVDYSSYNIPNGLALFYPHTLSLSTEQMSVINFIKGKVPFYSECRFFDANDITEGLDSQRKEVDNLIRSYYLSSDAQLCAIILCDDSTDYDLSSLVIPRECKLFCINLGDKEIDLKNQAIRCYKIIPNVWQHETLRWFLLRLAAMPEECTMSNCKVHARLLRANEQLLSSDIIRGISSYLNNGSETTVIGNLKQWVDQQSKEIGIPTFSQKPVLWSGWEWLQNADRKRTFRLSYIAEKMFGHYAFASSYAVDSADKIQQFCNAHWEKIKNTISSPKEDFIRRLVLQIQSMINELEGEKRSILNDITSALNAEVTLPAPVAANELFTHLNKPYCDYCKFTIQQCYFSAIKDAIDSDKQYETDRISGLRRLKRWLKIAQNYVEHGAYEYSIQGMNSVPSITWQVDNEEKLINLFSHPVDCWNNELLQKVVANFKLQAGREMGMEILCSYSVYNNIYQEPVVLRNDRSAAIPHLYPIDGFSDNDVVFISMSVG